MVLIKIPTLLVRSSVLTCPLIQVCNLRTSYGHMSAARAANSHKSATLCFISQFLFLFFFLHIVISSDINASCKKNLSQNKFRSIDVVDHSHHVDHCHIHNNKWIQTQDQKNHCMFYLFINTR